MCFNTLHWKVIVPCANSIMIKSCLHQYSNIGSVMRKINWAEQNNFKYQKAKHNVIYVQDPRYGLYKAKCKNQFFIWASKLRFCLLSLITSIREAIIFTCRLNLDSFAFNSEPTSIVRKWQVLNPLRHVSHWRRCINIT